MGLIHVVFLAIEARQILIFTQYTFAIFPLPE